MDRGNFQSRRNEFREVDLFSPGLPGTQEMSPEIQSSPGLDESLRNRIAKRKGSAGRKGIHAD